MIFFDSELNSQNRKVNRTKALEYLKAGKLDSAKVFANKARLVSDSDNSKADIAIIIGRIKRQKDQPSNAIEYYDSLNASLRQKNMNSYLAVSLLDYGAVYKSIGDIDKALEVFKESYLLFQSTGLSENSSKATGAIANIYKSTGDYRSAKGYFKTLLASRKVEKDSIGIGVIMNNLGLVFLDESLLDSAISLFRESLKFRLDRKRHSITLLNIGEVFRRQNRFDSAEYYFLKSLKIKEEINNQAGLSILHNNLAALYIDWGKTSKSKLHLSKGEELASQRGQLKERTYNKKLWSEYYEVLGNNVQAIKSLKEYIFLRESLVNEERVRTVSEMQVRFDSERKEVENKLQKTEIKSQEYIILTLIISASALLIVSVLLFLLFRLKQKQKKATEWRMREQHHRVGNNIAVLSTMLSRAGNEANSDEAKTLALEGKSRLEAMNLLHSKLYWKDETAKIPLKTYITELTNQVLSLYIPYQPNAVSLDIEGIDLPVTQAIPFSLILNEVLTNACKYGLQNTKTPKLEIQLLSADGRMEIVIRNNGLTNELVDKERKSPSFGVTLIQTLARQLHGTFSIDIQKTHAIGRFEMPINS